MTLHPPETQDDERPLRVAFIVPEDRKTGTYFRTHNLAVALTRLGHTVRVHSQSNVDRMRVTHEERDGVSYSFTPTVPGNRFIIGPVNPANIARRLFSEIENADVYHLFQPFPSAAIAWLALRERRPGVFAYDWDDFWINDEFGLKHPSGLNARVTSLWLRFLESHLPSRCDLLTTLSRGIAGLGFRRLTAESVIIYNGVWPEPMIDRTEARACLGLQPDAIYVGMMGWSGEIYWALESMRRLMHSHPRLRLAWCGQDPSAQLAGFPEIRDRVDAIGHLEDKHLQAFKCSVDLGLIPMADTEFNRYRLPYKLTDFLEAGTPVLASGIGETAVLAAQLPGIRTCAATFESWNEAFGESLVELEKCRIPTRVDRRILLANFDWRHVASKLVRAYRAARTPVRVDVAIA